MKNSCKAPKEWISSSQLTRTTDYMSNMSWHVSLGYTQMCPQPKLCVHTVIIHNVDHSLVGLFQQNVFPPTTISLNKEQENHIPGPESSRTLKEEEVVCALCHITHSDKKPSLAVWAYACGRRQTALSSEFITKPPDIAWATWEDTVSWL